MEAVGCDVGKRRIDVCLATSHGVQLSNERLAIERFARTLPANSLVGMEATGRYHELLAQILVAAGHRVYVINARWIHAYSRGLGMRGKTDRTDAQVIARYTTAEHAKLRSYQPPSPEQLELRTLLQRRHAAAKLLATARQSLAEDAEALLAVLKTTCTDIERRIARLLRSRPEWAGLAERLRSVPGVGALTSAQLVATLTRMPFSRVEAFVAHTGTDPRPNDSGQKRGRRVLTHHGDASLRGLLFMAAMTATRSPAWRRYYLAQQAKGLSRTAALVVVARRIARITFSLYKTGETYDPARMTTKAA
jgi:transposase